MRYFAQVTCGLLVDAALDEGSIVLQEKAGIKSPCKKRPREGSLERGSVSRGGLILTMGTPLTLMFMLEKSP